MKKAEGTSRCHFKREGIVKRLRTLPVLTVILLLLGARTEPAWGFGQECARCHAKEVNEWATSKHAVMGCETCHEKTDLHYLNPTVMPVVHFDMETCAGCHPDQYNSSLRDEPGKTFYGGSLNPPTLWNKTKDMPFWNSLIDGHPFVIETYEERAMKYNQLDARDTLRPMTEACLACHGTAVAYYMGLNGVPGYKPGKIRTIRNTQVITSGNFLYYQNIDPITIPAGTEVSTTLDTVNEPRYQVKSLVKLPDGRIYTSYTLPGATATGNDPDPVKRQEARNYVWAALQAMAFDGMDPVLNKNSMDAIACNMCHNPRSGKLRIIQKPLIKAINERGINPYERSQYKTFDSAPRQDKLIAICGQCHSEYVGGYSAVDHTDRFFFPWAKPRNAPKTSMGLPIPGTEVPGVNSIYQTLFDYNQDWTHGEGVRPYQSSNKNKPGYAPKDSLFPINAPLAKIQHPEAEAYWNSEMYFAGATCIDCHSVQETNPATGEQYTSHFFTSPIKYIDNDGVVPCSKCHLDFTGAKAKRIIKSAQNWFFSFQEEVQGGLVTSLKYINSLPAGAQKDAAVDMHRQAWISWEFWTQGENSMGFHNFDWDLLEFGSLADLAATQAELNNSIPLPMPPVRLRATTIPGQVNLIFYDQATKEDQFVIERKVSGGKFAPIATIPSPSLGIGVGDAKWADKKVTPGKTYVYRVAAKNAEGTSSYSLEKNIKAR